VPFWGGGVQALPVNNVGYLLKYKFFSFSTLFFIVLIHYPTSCNRLIAAEFYSTVSQILSFLDNYCQGFHCTTRTTVHATDKHKTSTRLHYSSCYITKKTQDSKSPNEKFWRDSLGLCFFWMSSARWSLN